MKLILALIIFSLGHAAQFVIIVPSYNNQESFKKNLDSIFTQSHQDFRVIYIDDGSTDETPFLVQKYLNEKDVKEKTTLIRNEKNLGPLACLYQAVWSCSPKEIVIYLDGGSWFSHRNVLDQLNEAYSNRSVWLTLSEFMYYPEYERGFTEEIPQEIIKQNAYRTSLEHITLDTSFYAGLFQQIKKEDLLENGAFFRSHFKLAVMLPMLEMAAQHIRFIPEIHYFHNTSAYDLETTSLDLEEPIRLKSPYEPILHYNVHGPTKKILITPGLWGQLFDINTPFFNRDDCLEVMVRLRETLEEEGYELIQVDSFENLGDFEYLVVYDIFLDQLPSLEKLPPEKLILFLWEPPSVLPENFRLENHRHFSKVYTWNDDLVDNEKYFKFYYPVLRDQIPNPIDYYYKRLCTLVACNKISDYPDELYSERLKLIEFFENLPSPHFDLFGRGWPGFYKTYQGPIDRKVDTLKYYRFCFAYENIKNIPGYITEKIFDCFQAASIPIYLGASNIDTYVPSNCYIDRRDFSSDAEMYAYLAGMSKSEYLEYMSCIQAFLASEAAQKYSIENFIKTFMSLLP